MSCGNSPSSPTGLNEMVAEEAVSVKPPSAHASACSVRIAENIPTESP